MTDFLGSLLTEKEEIAKALRQRKKKFIEKKITAKNLELLDDKLAIEEKDGWNLKRKNKASYIVEQDKPADEQLEDEVWSILAQMQFEELSDGRYFKIQTDKNVDPRQIDVFAKDAEVARDANTKNLKKLHALHVLHGYINSVYFRVFRG